MSTYHHGDLRRALLQEAAQIAEESGAESVTLRALARRTHVSHSAPVHHFKTRQGLLTALATEGFEELHAAVSQHSTDIYAMGVAYVTWALEHPGLYAVMWQPRLLDDSHVLLDRSRRATWDVLVNALVVGAAGQRSDDDIHIDAYAAFSVVHGLASIWLSGALPKPDHPGELIAQVTSRLRFFNGKS